MLIEKDKVYGDYRAVERISEKRDLFKVECVHCTRSRRMFRADVLALAVCNCVIAADANLPAVIRPKDDDYSLSAIADRLNNATGDDEEEIPSTFADQEKEIRDLIDVLDVGGLDGDRKFQLVSLKMAVDLLPIAEREFRKYPKQSNAFMVNALLTQARELFQDLQVTEDRTEQAVKIINKILQPFLTQITQVLIDNMFALQRTTEGALPSDRTERIVNAFGDTLKEVGREYQKLFFSVNKQIMEEFQ